MARQAKTNLATVTARKRLDPRDDPYFTQIAPRKTLGYVRPEVGAGSWVVREVIDGKRKTRTLGIADDVETADGEKILTYQQALAAATKPLASTPKARGLTVKAAFEPYLKTLAGRSDHAKETEQRAEKWIYPALGGYRVNRLTKGQIEAWQVGMVREDPDDPDVRRRSQDSANRVLTILKAALNHAFANDSNGIPTDKAWRTVKPFRNVGGAREDDFEPVHVRKLIAEAAQFDKAFADLCAAAYLTGARLGELTALLVRHFDAERALLMVPTGKSGYRPVTLSTEGVAFFRKLTDNRPPRAVLLPRADGDRWGKSEQHRPFKRAAAAAGLPASASFFTLRHSYISRAIESLMPLSLIAENCGTSLTMIQRYYAHVLAKTRKATIDATAPKFRWIK